MPATVHVQLADVLDRRQPAFGDSAAIRRLLRSAARAVLQRDRTVQAELSITLLDDARIAALNRQYLSRDGPTDVIAFPLYEPGEMVVGDVYIGADQAARQAVANDVPLAEELVRLTVHGVLHVLGHDHPAGDERADSAMWRLQEEIVQRVVRG
jgi:probable rRNA maturation factor